MQKRMQKRLAILVLTIMLTVTITGSALAAESTFDDSVDTDASDLQNNEITSECNTITTDNNPNNNYRNNNHDNEQCEDNNKDRDNNHDNEQCEDNNHDNEQCEDNNRNHNHNDNSSIGDLVWDDLNANGIQDPNEPGLAGVTVNLWKGNENSPLVKTNYTTVTNATGNYIFENLKRGIYWLEFIAPNSVVKWIFSPQYQGDDGTTNSDANAAGIVGPICLKCNDAQLDWDVGLYMLAAVGNRVWEDINKNGIQDPTEPGVANVTVNLWTGTATEPLVQTIYSTITDINGDYMFTNLVPGIYWLQFVLPDSISTWIFTLQNVGTNPALDSNANANGIAGPIELISGEVDLTWDAGLDPGNAAGGDGAAGGDEDGAAGEPIIEEVFAAGGEVFAAGETIPLQDTGVPVGLLVMAVLMVLAGLIVPRK
jgi:hypothetical protein